MFGNRSVGYTTRRFGYFPVPICRLLSNLARTHKSNCASLYGSEFLKLFSLTRFPQNSNNCGCLFGTPPLCSTCIFNMFLDEIHSVWWTTCQCLFLMSYVWGRRVLFIMELLVPKVDQSSHIWTYLQCLGSSTLLNDVKGLVVVPLCATERHSFYGSIRLGFPLQFLSRSILFATNADIASTKFICYYTVGH